VENLNVVKIILKTEIKTGEKARKKRAIGPPFIIFFLVLIFSPTFKIQFSRQ